MMHRDSSLPRASSSKRWMFEYYYFDITTAFDGVRCLTPE